MNDKRVRELYKGLEAAMYSVERDRCVGEFADDCLIVDLALRVIREIDALPGQGRKMMERREMAEAVAEMYGPLPHSARPREYPVGLDALQHA
jgi:hypothetical protein